MINLFVQIIDVLARFKHSASPNTKVIKKFMLNSTEQEIYPAQNVKMPTIVTISECFTLEKNVIFQFFFF